MEKECLSIIWALGKFRFYFFGYPFNLVAGYHAFCWLSTIKDLTGLCCCKVLACTLSTGLFVATLMCFQVYLRHSKVCLSAFYEVLSLSAGSSNASEQCQVSGSVLISVSFWTHRLFITLVELWAFRLLILKWPAVLSEILAHVSLRGVCAVSYSCTGAAPDCAQVSWVLTRSAWQQQHAFLYARDMCPDMRSGRPKCT